MNIVQIFLLYINYKKFNILSLQMKEFPNIFCGYFPTATPGSTHTNATTFIKDLLFFIMVIIKIYKAPRQATEALSCQVLLKDR